MMDDDGSQPLQNRVNFKAADYSNRAPRRSTELYKSLQGNLHLLVCLTQTPHKEPGPDMASVSDTQIWAFTLIVQ